MLEHLILYDYANFLVKDIFLMARGYSNLFLSERSDIMFNFTAILSIRLSFFIKKSPTLMTPFEV